MFDMKVVLLVVLTMSTTGCMVPKAVDTDSDRQQVRSRVELLLERYAANDQDGVVEMLDPSGVTILGTDLGEIIHTPSQLRALMDADFRLWTTAKFTDIRAFDFRSDGTLATAYFVASFSPAGGPSIPIRITTTWRKTNKNWYLTQSSNAVPTVGQSTIR